MLRLSVFILFSTIFFSIGFLQCKTQEFTPYDYKEEILIFGKGGGFTGESIEYSLLSNGQIFKGTNKEGNVIELKKLKKRKVDQIFKNYHLLKFDEMMINRPGNIYYYLELKQGELKHKIQWGAHDFNCPETLNIYFSNLMATVKTLNTELQ
jgi:hypothetical protein